MTIDEINKLYVRVPELLPENPVLHDAIRRTLQREVDILSDDARPSTVAEMQTAASIKFSNAHQWPLMGVPDTMRDDFEGFAAWTQVCILEMNDFFNEHWGSSDESS